MNVGDRIFLPITVQQEVPFEKQECHCNEEEVNFIHSLVLYKVFKFDPFAFVYLLRFFGFKCVTRYAY